MQQIKAALKESRNDLIICSEQCKQLLSSCCTNVAVLKCHPTIKCNPLTISDNDELSLEGNSDEAESTIF